MPDGLVSVTVEDEELAVGPEGFVLVPRGTAHTFGNAADREARLLVIHAPAMDAYFAELHELWNPTSTPGGAIGSRKRRGPDGGQQ